MSLRLFVLPGFSLNFPIPTAGLNSNLPKPVGAVPPQGIELLNFVPLTGRKTQRFAGSRSPDAESGNADAEFARSWSRGLGVGCSLRGSVR